jgi:crossover junction endodeoxyribonuclease RuvC
MGIYGLDLSLTGTGICDGKTTWLQRSKGVKGASLADRADRLNDLAHRILEDLAGAQLVVVEGPAMGSNTGHMHDRSGLWWLVVHGLRGRGISVVEVPPSCLKRYATGKGNASKGEVIEAVTRRFPEVETGGDDNRCDALVLAAMGHDRLAMPLTVMPAAHRASLESVRWAS